MAGADRKRQKKLEQSRKKRELLKKQTRQREARFEGAGLLRTAREAPFGPAWVSTSLTQTESEPNSDSESFPSLVTAVITRRVRGLFLAETMVVDRTCLGIKDAMLTRPMTEAELLELIDRMSSGVDPLRQCEPLEVQSVVFHSLDFARSLGFRAHEDFEIALLEPRPEVLLDTPLARPDKPVFISGPNDNVQAILSQLEARVGSGNYAFLSGFGQFDQFDGELALFGEEENDDELDEDDRVAGAIETTAESADG